MEAMDACKDAERRITLFYLLDSLVQTSQKQNAARTAPEHPEAAKLYRQIISTATKRVVQCVCKDLHGCEKAQKVGAARCTCLLRASQRHLIGQDVHAAASAEVSACSALITDVPAACCRYQLVCSLHVAAGVEDLG